MATGAIGGAAIFEISPELLQRQNETTSQSFDPLSVVPMSADRIDSRASSKISSAEPEEIVSSAQAKRLDLAIHHSSAAPGDGISIGQLAHVGGASYASASENLGTYNGHPLKRGADGRLEIELPDGSLIHAPSTAGTFNDSKIDDHTVIAHRARQTTQSHSKKTSHETTAHHARTHDTIALSNEQSHHMTPAAQSSGAATTLSPATQRSQARDLRDARDHMATVTHAGMHSSTTHHAAAIEMASATASAPRTARPISTEPDVSRTSVVDRATSTMAHGLAIAAHDAGGEIKKTLSDPKTVAMIGAGTAAAIGVQFVPIVGEAVDVAAGVAGAAMYAAAGPEHKARIGRAVGELKSYLHDVSTAKTQGDLDRASRHFAKFVELGGQEAVDGLTAIAGAASAPAKFASLAAKVGELGGPAGIAAAAVRTGGPALDAIKSGAANLVNGAKRSMNDVEQAIHYVLQPHGPQLATAGAGGYGNIAIRQTAHLRTADEIKPGSGIRGTFAKDTAEGGHVAAKHIGKSDSWLRSRLDKEPKRTAVSTFSSEGTAAHVQGEFFAKYHAEIAKWEAMTDKNADSYKKFIEPITLPQPVGRVMVRGASNSVSTNTARFVLQRVGAHGFRVVTGYPALK